MDPDDSSSGRRDLAAPRSGLQHELIVLVSPSCFACQGPELARAVHEIMAGAAAQAEASHERLSTLGVSIGSDHEAGLAMLRRFGPFDEISLGGGWENTAVRSLGNAIMSSVIGTPAVLLRRYGVEVNGSRRLTVLGSVPGAQLIGREAILQFAADLKAPFLGLELGAEREGRTVGLATIGGAGRSGLP